MKPESPWILRAVVLAALAGTVCGDVAGNPSLNGKFYFRQVLLIADGSANVTDTRTGFGTLTFDGNGNYTLAAQQLVGTAPPVALNGSGTYSVKPGGFATISNPLRAGAFVNARISATGVVVGSSTEAGATVFDLFIAVPASTKAPTVSGPYWISSLELPGGGVASIRGTNFKLTANGAGSFTETTITGQAHNLGDKLQNQTVSPMTYNVTADGSGTASFPTGGGLDTNTQLIAGNKAIYFASDGSYFVGGSTVAGGHGFVVGVKGSPGTGSANATWSNFFVSAGMRYDLPAFTGGPARFAAAVGAVNATPSGAVWARRTRQSDGLFDASPLIGFSLGPDGGGQLTSTPGHLNVASTGQAFSTNGVSTIDNNSYELYFGARMLDQSATGAFLNPLGVLNAGSFAPPGYPVSPGGFVYLYGTGLGTQTTKAGAFPFPLTMAGVQVTINGIPAPIYAVSPTRIDCVVPYAATGTTVIIFATINGTKSNTIELPLAASSPGIFSLTQNGLGDAAILHADFSVVNADKPAKPGETVQMYLTGLGAVSPAVTDGAAAPGKEPLARVPAALRVTIGGITASVAFQGLAPTLAGLYQLNVQIPAGLAPGTQGIAVQTLEGFTDMVSVRVSP